MLFQNVTQGCHPLYCTPNKVVWVHVCVHVRMYHQCLSVLNGPVLTGVIVSFVGNRQQKGLYFLRTNRSRLDGEENLVSTIKSVSSEDKV